jgi:hypothetical protein
MGLFWCVGRREGHDEGGWLGLYTEACVKVVDPHILEFRQKKDNQRGPREREREPKEQKGPGRARKDRKDRIRTSHCCRNGRDAIGLRRG